MFTVRVNDSIGAFLEQAYTLRAFVPPFCGWPAKDFWKLQIRLWQRQHHYLVTACDEQSVFVRRKH
jgi:hypothetical protein